MAYADVSLASANASPVAFGSPNYINFGAGYIDAPLSQTQTPTATATAALGQAASGSEGTVAGLTTTQLLTVGGLGAVVFLAAVFLITHKT